MMEKMEYYTPEEKIAQKVFKKFKLTLPVDVEGLVKHLADVDSEEMPFDVDAIVLNEEGCEKPLILLNSNKNKSLLRKRFTLSHELGHLFIPWHTGTILCHTDIKTVLSDHFFKEIEKEANRFASELLMPSFFIKTVLEQYDNLQDIMEAIYTTCQVSLYAVCLRIASFLEPGYIYNFVYENNIEVFKSQNTVTFIQDTLNWDYITSLSSDHGSFQIQSTTVNWWKLSCDKKIFMRIYQTSQLRKFLNE